MARIFLTTDPPPNSATAQLHVYNGLDCCVTLEVLEVIKPQLDEVTQKVYDFERELQGPILAMETRGVKIDLAQRNEVAFLIEKQIAQVKASLQEILLEGLGIDLQFNKLPSPQQLQHLFYKTLGIRPVILKGKVTTNRKALEKIGTFFHAGPIVNHILKLRDLQKRLGVLKTGVDPDGRIRTSFNIAGTDTGRLSSYVSAFGSGTNLQNITGELRSIFVADEGKKFAYIDLEQAESRAVGAIIWNLFQDRGYLDACESGDLHTKVSIMCWPHITTKEEAKANFYRIFSYRDAAKRLGHATNYFGKPPQISRETRIDQQLVANFQRQYFSSFPGMRQWHDWVRAKLLRDGWLTTFMGRRRWFFGRRWEEETLRAAIAYEPQSAVADYLNQGMLNFWRTSASVGAELLLQIHDAILIQFPEEREAEVLALAKRCLELEVPLLHNRSLIIPTEAFVGWNWAYSRNDKKELVNPNGLELFTGHDSRKRIEAPSFLDRRVSR